MNINLSLQNKSIRQNNRRERIGALATLPVFFKLTGKKVLVAGGSDAAAWKAELLASAGAEVHIYAQNLEPCFLNLIDEGSASGQFHWYPRAWRYDCFEAMSIAICDAKTASEAEAFYCAARKAGVPVNVIDKPKYCEFQFGSIVNRSPVVIGISTDGAAPILGQAIRRRIEAVFSPSLAAWAGLAQSIRGAINEQLSMGAQRRAFWEIFVDHAFGPAPQRNAVEELLAKSAHVAASSLNSTGQITLVNTELDDVELLTLKAVRALQAADVILFDEAISSKMLELARREAKRLPVCKSESVQVGEQIGVEEMMRSLAQSGLNVVRLKCQHIAL